MAGTLGFDVAAGIYESTLNDVSSQVYHALYPDLLKGNIEVNKISVDYDFQCPPSVSLTNSEVATAHIASAFKTFCNAQQAKSRSAVLEIASSATFTATVSKLALTVNYANGEKVKTVASLVVHATASVEDSYMTVKILAAKVNIPKNQYFTDLLNNVFVPYLIDYLNKKILGPIKIPPLAYKSLELSSPLPVVQQSYLTAFSALGSTPATIPAPLPWPKDGIYIAIGIPAIEKAAGAVFPLGPQDNFSWGVFSGHVGATLNTPTVSSINADGSINATIEANASCQLTMKTPEWVPFDISFGPSATVGVACTLARS